MNIKVMSSIVALTMGTTLGAIAQAETESSKTTIERSTSVDVSKPVVNEQTTTTKTKRGLLGREKSETTTSTTSREGYPENTVKSRTTTETERRY